MLCGCADGNINHRVQSKQLYNYTINLLVYWYIHECMHAYMHTCMRAYMHTCINAYMHTCIHAYMHTCIHAYMHTYIHAYMHTCIYWEPGGPGGCRTDLWLPGGVERACGRLVRPNPLRDLARLYNTTTVQLYIVPFKKVVC